MKILVKDVFEARTLSLIVNEEEQITEIIKHYAEKPSLRGIFVVDKGQKLKGVITRNDLLQWAKFKIGADIGGDAIAVDEINRYAYSTTAKDIMHRYSAETYVKPEDSLASALEMMLNEDTLAIPIVDEEKKIIGDLTLSEALNATVRTQIK
ncbi:MAG: CBS domain-containing protein [Candidatus Bathyarchaeota archaeon]|nr:CBS domain-containing protein [Candidatus Bathyarchaeota archaeon]